MNSSFLPFCPGFDEAMIRNLRNLRVGWVLQGRKFAKQFVGEVASLGCWRLEVGEQGFRVKREDLRRLTRVCCGLLLIVAIVRRCGSLLHLF